MAARKSRPEDNADLVQDLDQFRRPRQEEEIRLEPRKSRSKRGVVRSDPNTSQVCARIPGELHTALKVYCAANKKEVGEVIQLMIENYLEEQARRKKS
jgi:hypothetical protein